jgi:hypothetical protein
VADHVEGTYVRHATGDTTSEAPVRLLARAARMLEAGVTVDVVCELLAGPGQERGNRRLGLRKDEKMIEAVVALVRRVGDPNVRAEGVVDAYRQRARKRQPSGAAATEIAAVAARLLLEDAAAAAAERARRAR